MVHSFEYYIFDCNLNIKKVDIVLPSPPWLSGRTSLAFGRLDLVYSFKYYIFDCNLNIKRVDIVLSSPPWQSGKTSQAFDRHVA